MYKTSIYKIYIYVRPGGSTACSAGCPATHIYERHGVAGDGPSFSTNTTANSSPWNRVRNRTEREERYPLLPLHFSHMHERLAVWVEFFQQYVQSPQWAEFTNVVGVIVSAEGRLSCIYKGRLKVPRSYARFSVALPKTGCLCQYRTKGPNPRPGIPTKSRVITGETNAIALLYRWTSLETFAFHPAEQPVQYGLSFSRHFTACQQNFTATQ